MPNSAPTSGHQVEAPLPPRGAARDDGSTPVTTCHRLHPDVAKSFLTSDCLELEGSSIVVAQNDKFYGSAFGVELDVEILGLQAMVVYQGRSSISSR
ncbi:hypothetical protein M0R45_036350 [Rubus argutus]|uniref:Uncharacterized protein n=1 Tax=Rubus argutus TaxID=59490 RepID=A0AAW1W0V6_RUBAR